MAGSQTRRQVLTNIAALTIPMAGSLFRPDTASATKLPFCDFAVPAPVIAGRRQWDEAYETRWGRLGWQSRDQIDYILHNVDGVYDDVGAEFAWIIHYWIRAWLAMASLTGWTGYMDACASVIDYMFDHTDEKRVARGEMVEDYIRDPLALQGSGRGGPFWKRENRADVLNTGQIARAIMYFVDAVYSNPNRWQAYRRFADRYFGLVTLAADAFDNDWRDFGDKGSYFYRDSEGSGVLGTTATAFNQSATMVEAHLLIHKWRPDPARANKVRRLARYWLEEFLETRPDGTLVWPYMIHPELGVTEDTGHATIDVDFLVAAYASGLTDLDTSHMQGLVRTFMAKVYDGNRGLNAFVDGRQDPGFSDHYNAGFGWFRLARFEPRIVPIVARIYNAHYPPDSPPGQLWARPMLGWANILNSLRRCGT